MQLWLWRQKRRSGYHGNLIMIENTKLYIMLIVAYIAAGIIGLMFFNITWWHVAIAWLFYAIGNGTIGHRYFSHHSFKVSASVHWLLGLWCTLCAYSPVHYWQVQHLHHHRNTDTTKDLHSPKNGLLQAFIFWPFSSQRIEDVFRERSSLVVLAKAFRDKPVKFFSSYFFIINATALLILASIDYTVIFSTLGVAYIIEQIRLGLVNTVTHLPFCIGNYINHPHVGSDQSQNNWLLGLITLGFAWHNNHHADPKKLILTERWWEIDIEGYIGWLLSLTSRVKIK
jgi:stearoyl-CoA desaturase (delta-9 desaturase)